MASELELKNFVACWMQLGKGIQRTSGQSIHLDQVIQGEDYSEAFKAFWNQWTEDGLQNVYLEGTSVSLSALNTALWEIVPCARCTMPVALPIGDVASCICPCHDLADWPNNELPTPRPPVSNKTHLDRIFKRLNIEAQNRSTLME
jgi:hypothetical protein